MKKKLALLLAAVMTVSMLPVNVFAAGTVTVSPYVEGTRNNVPSGTLMYENGIVSTVNTQFMGGNGFNTGAVSKRGLAEAAVNWDLNPSNTSKRLSAGPVTTTNATAAIAKLAGLDHLPDYVVDGNDLVIKLDRGNFVEVGTTFNLRLENAKWFFRANGLTDVDNSGFGTNADLGTLPRITTPDGAEISTLTSSATNQDKVVGAALSSAALPTSVKMTEVATVIDDMFTKSFTAANVSTRSLNGLKSFWTLSSDYISILGGTVWPDTTYDVSTIANNDDYSRSGLYRVSSTYDWQKGLYFPRSTGDNKSAIGDYVRFAADITMPYDQNINMEIPYIMSVQDDSTAVVTITGTPYIVDRSSGVFDVYNIKDIPYNNSMEKRQDTDLRRSQYRSYTDRSVNDHLGAALNPVAYQIRIPLVVKTTANGAAKVSIEPTNLTGIMPNSYTFANIATTAGDVVPSVANQVQARDQFNLDPILFSETRVGTIRDNSTDDLNGSVIVLSAPTGFTFRNNWDDLKLDVRGGLTWRNKPSGTQSGTEMGKEDRGTLTTNTSGGTSPVTLAAGKRWGINYYWDAFYNRFEEDKIVIYFDKNTLVPSTAYPGTLMIKGLSLLANDQAVNGPVRLTVCNSDTLTSYNKYSPYIYGYNPISTINKVAYLFGSTASFQVGTRAEYDMMLEATPPATPLVSGRYDHGSVLNGTTWSYNGGLNVTAESQTGRVTFKENTVNAWWTGRNVDFTLQPLNGKQAKFRRVTITAQDNITNGAAIKDTTYVSNLYRVTPPAGMYLNDGENHGYVKVNDSTMSINNLGTTPGTAGKIEMDMWVSIESGYAGGAGPVDLVLRASGTAIPTQSNGNNYVERIIARVVDPITVTVAEENQYIRLGVQYQSTSDIVIAETKAGMLLANKEVRVAVSDLMSNDVIFTPSTTATVTSTNSELKIGGVTVNQAGSATGSLIGTTNNASGVRFNVTAASRTNPGTITIANVGLKVDRTVPESINYNYDAIVWGTAVAENFGTNKDQFQTPGIKVPYIYMGTPAVDEGILAHEVRVPADASYMVVKGKEVPYEDTNVKPYLSTASDSMMVPLRFVSYAFGISEDSVIWDSQERTATIITPYKVVQFKANSDRVTVDGVTTQMLNAANKAVQSEIKGDRLYIPFRILGNAFGIPVEYDATTREAIYNKGLGLGSKVVETTAE